MKHGLVTFAFVGALCTVFLVAWIVVVASLGQEACLDRGGVVTDAGYACSLAGGSLVTVTSLISRRVVVFAALAVGAPLLLLWFALRGRFGTRR